MILKGSSRRGAVDLALHLNNCLDNERVIISEVRGAVSTNLYDAFREWELISDQSKAKNSFYSLSINPDPEQREWTDKEWKRAIEHVEAKLGLTGQPRAIVYHHKVGEYDDQAKERMHCHVVWSRIQVRDHQLRAISDSHDYYKLRDAAKELAMEFGLTLRRGRKSKEPFDYALSQGKNRDPETAEARKATITKLWEKHQDPKEFAVALSKAGYILAQGDRRSFVVIDTDAQIHALARQIHSVRTKQVRERLGNEADYPTVEQAIEEQRIKVLTEVRDVRRETRKRVNLTKEQKLMAKLKRMARRADQLKDQRRSKLKAERHALKQKHFEEWEWRHRRFRTETAKIIRKRKLTAPTGLTKYLRTAIGYETLLRWKHAQQDRERARAFEREQQRIKKAQAKELERIKKYKAILERQEKREAKSFERLAKKLSLRKEQIAKVLEQDRQRLEGQKRNQYELTL